MLMRKGDYVIELSAEGAWILCRHCLTGVEGYVPNSFLAPYKSLESEPWFFGPITRAKVRGFIPYTLRFVMCGWLGREVAWQPYA